MQPFAVAVTATAGTVLVNAGIRGLVFRLAGLAIHLNIIDLDIAIAVVVIVELHGNTTGGVSAVGIVLHGGGEGPIRDNVIVNQQVDMFAAGGSPRANYNGVAPATAGARCTAGGTA